MLSGTNPFDERGFANVVDAVVRRPVPRLPDIPAPIWEVMEKALRKDPADRFNDATEFGIALRSAAGRKSTTESSPILPVAPSSTRRSSASLDSIPSTTHSGVPAAEVPPPRSGRTVRAVAGGIAVLALLGLVGLFWFGSRASEGTPAASTAGPGPALTALPAHRAALSPAAREAVSAAAPEPEASGSPSAGASSRVPSPPAPSAAKRRKSAGDLNNGRDPGF
jgi:serine/threonine-protein kinase